MNQVIMAGNEFAGRPRLTVLKDQLLREAPYLVEVIDKQIAKFGENWATEFETSLQTFFGDDDERLELAVRGYIRFALDGMLLQKRFDRTGQYEPKTYEEAASEVYQNEEYMHSLYLPGIYLSHFLWHHHYLQQLFFAERFIPKVKEHGGSTFYDIGVGTGFYSCEFLRQVTNVNGRGFDLSNHSLSYTNKMISAFNLSDRYTTCLRDVLDEPQPEQASFIINIEVLEHLEDPLTFLKGLYRMLEPGGIGLIAAAVTAPNADHIYLYNSGEEVADQVSEAGFDVLEFQEDPAYEARDSRSSVPRNAMVLVTKGM